jgi:hypothetical protein
MLVGHPTPPPSPASEGEVDSTLGQRHQEGAGECAKPLHLPETWKRWVEGLKHPRREASRKGQVEDRCDPGGAALTMVSPGCVSRRVRVTSLSENCASCSAAPFLYTGGRVRALSSPIRGWAACRPRPQREAALRGGAKPDPLLLPLPGSSPGGFGLGLASQALTLLSLF